MNTLSFLFTFAGLTATIAFTFTSKTTSKTIPSSVSSSSILSIKSFINTKLYQQSNDSDNDNDEERSELDSIILSKVSKHFKSNLLYTYTLTNHKPLGCTAEESLYQGGDDAIDDDDNDNAQIDFSNEDGSNTKFVFISKLVPGGYAASVGLEVGDLIVGLSGTFDELVDVFGEGLDRVRSLIAGRPEEKALTIKIIRNTDVLAKHESALIDLCTLPEGQLYGRDKTIETCIETMYTMNYDVDDTDGSDIASACGDDDMECMLDTISNLWNDDVDDNDSDFEERKRKEEDEKKRNEMKKPAPWSSRSSPSGTYVRVNGTMVNIDE